MRIQESSGLRKLFTGAVLLAAGLLPAHSLRAQGANGTVGALFLATNNASHNQIIMYNRLANGKLRLVGRYPTGGRGEGGVNDPLQSQSSLIISPDRAYLLAVNAGTSDISVFRISDYGLILASVTPSGGGNPVSLAIHDDLVYAVNFGGNLHTAGFRLQTSGDLTPVAGSSLPLSGLDPGASTAAFTPDGSKLIVTERVANKIDVFTVNSDGSLTNPTFNDSQGIEPFGAQFTPGGALLVTETGGGPFVGGSTSSYQVNGDNTLTVVSSKVTASGGATCWVVNNGKYAWVSNTTTSNIGAYSVGGTGALSPLGIAAIQAASAGAPLGTSFPLDSGISSDDRYFYVFYSTLGQVAGYKIGDNGQLTQVTLNAAEKPQVGAAGLAVY